MKLAVLLSLLWASVFFTTEAENGSLQSLRFPYPSMDKGQSLQDETLHKAIGRYRRQTSRQGQNGHSLPPFPVFNDKVFIEDEYDAMLSSNCKPSFNRINYNEYSVVDLICTASATASEIRGITEAFRGSARSVRVTISGEDALSPEVLEPVEKNVVYLEIRHCTTRTTLSKLPSLQLSSLMDLEVRSCENLIIKKRDFANNKRLRMITFTSSTIQSIEKYTFMDLPQLTLLSLEWGISTPFTPSEITHLQRFHCDCEYSWLRSWFLENPYVIAKKLEYEVYRVNGASSLALKQNDIFYAIDCQSDINRYTARAEQTTYSSNAEC